ncbi:hypothetical protein V8C86DRAFT_3035171 [Haematococcus lacustris]
MRTTHKRAAEGETGDPAPSSDEEQQQHLSGKRIAVAAEVFDAVAQLDDGLRDKSIRSYSTQLKHYVRWCESQEPRCDDQDIVNSATLYYIYVVKLHGLIKRLRCKPHPTPAEEQELDKLETGPGSAHLALAAAGRGAAWSPATPPQALTAAGSGARASPTTTEDIVTAFLSLGARNPSHGILNSCNVFASIAGAHKKHAMQQAMGQLPKATKDLYKQAAKHINDVQGRVRKATRVASKK